MPIFYNGMASEPESPTDETRGVVEVSGNDELNELLYENQTVLLDFYADWCGPCQVMKPLLETLVENVSACVASVDTEANPGLAADFDVRGLPTFIVYEGGEEAERFLGLTDVETLRDAVV